jgi:hypothetical protein
VHLSGDSVSDILSLPNRVFIAGKMDGFFDTGKPRHSQIDGDSNPCWFFNHESVNTSGRNFSRKFGGQSI